MSMHVMRADSGNTQRFTSIFRPVHGKRIPRLCCIRALDWKRRREEEKERESRRKRRSTRKGREERRR